MDLTDPALARLAFGFPDPQPPPMRPCTTAALIGQRYGPAEVVRVTERQAETAIWLDVKLRAPGVHGVALAEVWRLSRTWDAEASGAVRAMVIQQIDRQLRWKFER